jgi:hypothetical protein
MSPMSNSFVSFCSMLSCFMTLPSPQLLSAEAQRLLAEIAERRRAREVRLADDLRRINAEYDAEVRGVRGRTDWQLRLHVLFWGLCAAGAVVMSVW